MGFPTKNPDGSPFRDDDEHIKCLELEIESLRRVKTLLEEMCNAEKERGDEWERRVWILLPFILGSQKDSLIAEFPEAANWFEVNDDERIT